MNTPADSGVMAPWLEQAWLVRYLDRQLDEKDQAWFEAYVLDKPYLLDELDSDTMLRDAVDSLRLSQGLSNNRTMKSAAGDSSRSGNQKSKVAIRYLPIAASFFAGIGLTWMGLQSLEKSMIIANPTKVVFDTLRGQLAEPLVSYGDASAGMVVVDVAVPAFASDPALLIDGAAFSLSPGGEGFATLLVNASRLERAEILQLRYEVDGRINQRELTIPNLRRSK